VVLPPAASLFALGDLGSSRQCSGDLSKELIRVEVASCATPVLYEGAVGLCASPRKAGGGQQLRLRLVHPYRNPHQVPGMSSLCLIKKEGV